MKAFLLTIALLFSNQLFAAELSDSLGVFELKEAGHTYTILTINRRDLFVVSAYQDYLLNGILSGALEWYLKLHERKGSFTDAKAIRKDFETGAESLHDRRSTYAIILQGSPEVVFRSIIKKGGLATHFFRGMVRISTASHDHPLPPFYGRLKTLPKDFPGQTPDIMKNDWAELKNLAQDGRFKKDFLPLALDAIEKSGWVDLGGYLHDKTKGLIVRQGHPSTISPRAYQVNEIEDAYEMNHQNDLKKFIFSPDPKRFTSSQVENYYLEFLVPEGESEGLSNPKKAKGLLAYYLRQGFNILHTMDDPSQPKTKVVIAGIDRQGWFKIINKSRSRRGGSLLEIPMSEIDFNNPHSLRRISKTLSCRKLFSK